MNNEEMFFCIPKIMRRFTTLTNRYEIDKNRFESDPNLSNRLINFDSIRSNFPVLIFGKFLIGTEKYFVKWKHFYRLLFQVLLAQRANRGGFAIFPNFLKNIYF